MGDSTTDSGRADELRMLLSAPAVGVPHGSATQEERQSYAERRLAQRETYGQYTATGPIYWPGTGILVFTTGQEVPLEHVEMWELELAGVVERVASPELARAGRRFASKAEGARWAAAQTEADEQQPGGDESPQGDTDPGQAGSGDNDDKATSGKPRRRAGQGA
jgi:hypothetical protein